MRGKWRIVTWCERNTEHWHLCFWSKQKLTNTCFMPGLTYNKLSVTVTQPQPRQELGWSTRGHVTSSPHICQHRSDNGRARALNLPLRIGLVCWRYLMRSLANRTLYWDELSVLSSISFVTYLTVWQVELITPDRIYPKWLKLPHLESQGGHTGGRNSDKIRKKLGLSWRMMFVMGEAIFFPNMENGKILNMKKNWVFSSFPYLLLSHILWKVTGGTFDLFISPQYSLVFTAPVPVNSLFSILTTCQNVKF